MLHMLRPHALTVKISEVEDGDTMLLHSATPACLPPNSTNLPVSGGVNYTIALRQAPTKLPVCEAAWRTCRNAVLHYLAELI